MQSRRIILCSFCVLGLVGVAARANVIFTSQVRRVTAQSDSTSCSDLGLFSATARESWAYPWPPYPPETSLEYVAQAAQDSTLASTAIAALGAAREWGPFYHGGSYSQSSQSGLQATFTLTDPYECLLTGRLEAWGDSGGTCIGSYQAWLTLSAGPSTVFSASATAPLSQSQVDTLDMDQVFMLLPGTYTLDLGASAWCSYSPHGGPYFWPGVGGSGAATYDIQLVAVPVPAVMPLTLCGLGIVAFLRRRILR